MHTASLIWVVLLLPIVVHAASPKATQPASQPGDETIDAYLRVEAAKVEADFLKDIRTPQNWAAARPRLLNEYFYMLGLSPMPERTPLSAMVTRTLPYKDIVVEMLHYQSRPGLYVTGNLYRPATVRTGERLPAVLYVCGHYNRGRDGNKTACQSFGIWFARHGYVCLVLDSLQLGEIGGVHHGTYRENRWWWQSRGYTPAGVECWNGIRGIDYLCSRQDVDPARIAVTGISGGGAATFWIAAADERVKAAAPVSGMADLTCYVGDKLINGHCDCMFMYNTFRWHWTQIAALIAPRPLLFVNSDADPIFPMSANERIASRMERFYSIFGAGDLFDAVVSIGGHAYRTDLRKATYRFMNTYLKNDPRVVTDSEEDLVEGEGANAKFPIAPQELRVFPQDEDIPRDQRNGSIDQSFVPLAEVQSPNAGEFDTWKPRLLKALRRVSFGYFPERVPKPMMAMTPSLATTELMTEPRIGSYLTGSRGSNNPNRILLVVRLDEQLDPAPAPVAATDAVFVMQPRGVGRTRWTRTNPPNCVERSMALLGRTVDTGRVWDIIAAARFLHDSKSLPVYVAGDGAAAVVAAYAALLEPDIAGAILVNPPATHMDSTAPAILNVLRVCDIPEIVGMLAPRPVELIGARDSITLRVQAIYAAAGAADRLRISEAKK